jgi:hypothetical protein
MLINDVPAESAWQQTAMIRQCCKAQIAQHLRVGGLAMSFATMDWTLNSHGQGRLAVWETNNKERVRSQVKQAASFISLLNRTK